ncbi:MAG: response regulator transcription factor [Acidimicrobiales bacterium]
MGDLGSRPLRVVLADDHALLREGLARALTDRGIEVVGQAGDGASAVEVVLATRPQVVLMDITMPSLGGVEAVRRIRQERPGTEAVMLTMHDDPDTLALAIAAGAAAYLVKDCSIDDLVETIASVVDVAFAQNPITDGVAERTSAGREPRRILSDREAEVLQCIADGLSVTEVAARLFISTKTVKNHLAAAYAGLGARDRTQAVIRAVRLGIVRLG